ncbi:MAG: hypothetical protein H6624_02920 [Bdellovibrionaceae bacterium]|nr:hypothetical protein [Bdellovibrionales bacterium]MCB9083265.1 hypothetical protein [Pseudobdellovibrionaceae bacterium]
MGTAPTRRSSISRQLILAGILALSSLLTLPTSAKSGEGEIRLMAQHQRVFESAFNKIINEEWPSLTQMCGTTRFNYRFHAVPEQWIGIRELDIQGPLMVGGFYVTFYFDLDESLPTCGEYTKDVGERLNQYRSVLATFHH